MSGRLVQELLLPIVHTHRLDLLPPIICDAPGLAGLEGQEAFALYLFVVVTSARAHSVLSAIPLGLFSLLLHTVGFRGAVHLLRCDFPSVTLKYGKDCFPYMLQGHERVTTRLPWTRGHKPWL
jgi:hypothetical protein